MAYGWKMYYGTWRPTTPPHCPPDITCIKDGSIWHAGGVCARWTTDFDCKQETDFWYCIKDTEFDIGKLNSKKRYYIKKGIANFEVKRINPADYLDDLYAVTNKALKTYDDYSAPQDRTEFVNEIRERDDLIFFGAFRENQLCGYIKIKDWGSYVDFMSMKADPEFEKKQINAAMVNALCEKYAERLRGGVYICDGMRNINHRTNFQDYLVRNFMFRKAYCRLHMAYPKRVGILVRILYPIREMIFLMNSKWKIRLFKKVSVILKCEEIARRTNRGAVDVVKSNID